VHHDVNGVLELEDFALNVHRDLAGEVAASDGGSYFGDIADLGGEVRGHWVDVVGQVLPRAGHAGHRSLAAKVACGADFARDPRNLGGKRAELIHHDVDGFLELENFAADVHGDFFGKVAVGDSDSDFGNVTDLGGEVAGHLVDRFGQFLPHAG